MPAQWPTNVAWPTMLHCVTALIAISDHRSVVKRSRQALVVIRLFFVQCVLYINVLHVISLSFIVLLELVKHILVAGVVRRNVKFNVKISNISISQTLFTMCCGG